MKKTNGVLQREIGGECILVPIGARVIDLNGLITLNATGRWVWDHLDEAHSLDDLAASLSARYAVERAQAHRDVDEFVTQLTVLGLVEA